MGNDANTVHPSNAIVVDSTNLTMTTAKVETATNMYAGRAVIKGTNDDDVVIADGSSIPSGWLGYEHTTKKYRPSTVTTIYQANDQVAVIHGPGMKLLSKLSNIGATTYKGQPLYSVAAGLLSPGTAGTNHMVAVAEEAITVDGAEGSTAAIIVRSLM